MHNKLTNELLGLGQILYFLWSNILSTACHYEIFFSICNMKKTVCIEMSNVTRIEPTILQYLSCFILHFIVSLKNFSRFDEDLAIFSYLKGYFRYRTPHRPESSVVGQV